MATKITPHGDECVVLRGNEKVEKIIMSQVRGCYQDMCAESLIRDGYVIGYKAGGDILKGKARDYVSRYMKSLDSLMFRIGGELPAGLYLVSGEVGLRGACGYYITDTCFCGE